MRVIRHMRADPARLRAAIAAPDGMYPAPAGRRPTAANLPSHHGPQGPTGIRSGLPGPVGTEAGSPNGCSPDDCGSPASAPLQQVPTRSRIAADSSGAERPLPRTGVAPASGTHWDRTRPAGRPPPIRRWRRLGTARLETGSRGRRRPHPRSRNHPPTRPFRPEAPSRP